MNEHYERFDVENIIAKLKDLECDYELLQKRVINIFEIDRQLKDTIHSIKHRLKNIDHLRDKIVRKNLDFESSPDKNPKGYITLDNVTDRITDIGGVRVLHIHQSQYQLIHERINHYISSGELVLFEPPKAYTWDPEYNDFFKTLGYENHQKESLYTSVHYVVKSNHSAEITCEVQIRTLFEEVWGEIDHFFNYPTPTENVAVKEQLKVLARLVGAGTKLADSIFMVGKTV